MNKSCPSCGFWFPLSPPLPPSPFSLPSPFSSCSLLAQVFVFCSPVWCSFLLVHGCISLWARIGSRERRDAKTPFLPAHGQGRGLSLFRREEAKKRRSVGPRSGGPRRSDGIWFAANTGPSAAVPRSFTSVFSTSAYFVEGRLREVPFSLVPATICFGPLSFPLGFGGSGRVRLFVWFAVSESCCLFTTSTTRT